ncbi:hypothetical protein [uncultured Mediterranean phage uvDeep-CGR2-AD12-C183]|nr:hypothetical protein [uncultured Mediterranean phage uvDeep-CGR2-AD12-C183]
MLKSKTVWTAITTCVGTIAAIAMNEISLVEGLQLMVPAILAIFLKHAVSKTQDAAEDAAEAAADAASAPVPAPKKKVIKKAI